MFPRHRTIVSLPFADRRAAGEALAETLETFRTPRTIVFGLARGGMVVADAVARALDLPLDVWLARKLGVPGQPELGMGAVAEGAAMVIDPGIVEWANVTDGELRAAVHREAREIRAQAERYRRGRPAPDVHGKPVILVDDGIATGATMRAVVRGARRRGAARVIVAVPVAAPESLPAVRDEADELVCLAAPEVFPAVGAWYDDFAQISDGQVMELLDADQHRRGRAA